MPLDGTSTPRRHASGFASRPAHAPFWRGAAGALALAGWTIAGVFWAALALLPAALEPGPRGRLRSVVPRRIVPDVSPAQPVAAARAAGDALRG